MKKKIAEKWVAALRSGEYKQGTKYLRSGDKFCCLGVLCDLAVKENIITDPVKKAINNSIYEYDHSDAGIASYSVREWSGLRDCMGMYDHSNPMGLAELNDSGKTFAEIADIIEKHYKEL